MFSTQLITLNYPNQIAVDQESFAVFFFFYQSQNLRISENRLDPSELVLELRDGSCSPQSLCHSVVEHRSSESEGLSFDSSQELRIFSLSMLVLRRILSFSSFGIYMNFFLSTTWPIIQIRKTFPELKPSVLISVHFFTWISLPFSCLGALVCFGYDP